MRSEWHNETSDCLLYVNLLIDYFNSIPEGTPIGKLDQWAFYWCEERSLQAKAIKEVHLLCL